MKINIKYCDLIDQSAQQPEIIPLTDQCDATHFDSEDDYWTGCQNSRQQSYSGLYSPEQSYSIYGRLPIIQTLNRKK